MSNFSKSDEWKMESMSTFSEEYVKYPIADLRVHELASINPMMNSIQFGALKDSIDRVGQKNPILIWRHFIIDGRNRTKALAELGADEVNALILPYNYTTEDLKELVMTEENRRHQTEAQRAIQAWALWKGRLGNTKKYKTAKDASNDVGVSETYIKKAEWVAKRRGEEILKELFNTGSCFLYNREVKNLATLQQLISTEDKENADAALKSNIEPITDEKKVAIKAYVDMVSSEGKEVMLEVAKRLYMKGKEI